MNFGPSVALSLKYTWIILLGYFDIIKRAMCLTYVLGPLSKIYIHLTLLKYGAIYIYRLRVLIKVEGKNIWNVTEILPNSLETFHWLMVLEYKPGNLVQEVDAFWMSWTVIVYLGYYLNNQQPLISLDLKSN